MAGVAFAVFLIQVPAAPFTDSLAVFAAQDPKREGKNQTVSKRTIQDNGIPRISVFFLRILQFLRGLIPMILGGECHIYVRLDP